MIADKTDAWSLSVMVATLQDIYLYTDNSGEGSMITFVCLGTSAVVDAERSATSTTCTARTPSPTRVSTGTYSMGSLNVNKFGAAHSPPSDNRVSTNHDAMFVRD